MNCEPLNVESEPMTIELKRRIAQEAAELVKTNARERQLELVGELAGSLGDLLQTLTGQPVSLQIITTDLKIAVVEDPPPAPRRCVARPLSEYHEDMGPVVWWRFPVNEPAWIGKPDDSDWPGYHTHFTGHPVIPEDPSQPTATVGKP